MDKAVKPAGRDGLRGELVSKLPVGEVADNRQMRLVPVQGENPWCNDNFDIWRQLELQFGIRSNTAYPGNWGVDPSKIMIRSYMKTTNQ